MREFNPGKMHQPLNNRYDQILDLWSNYAEHDLEIGAGVGMHPLHLGKTEPNKLTVALERTTEKFKKFDRSNSYQNVIAIHADVRPWLWFFDKEKKFNNIWILYPNPEPSNKNQRWTNQPFFSCLLKHLKPNGKIIIATNILKYFEESVENLKSTWGLDVQSEIYLGPYRTHFEKKYLERNETCYNLVATQRKN